MQAEARAGAPTRFVESEPIRRHWLAGRMVEVRRPRDRRTELREMLYGHGSATAPHRFRPASLSRYFNAAYRRDKRRRVVNHGSELQDSRRVRAYTAYPVGAGQSSSVDTVRANRDQVCLDLKLLPSPHPLQPRAAVPLVEPSPRFPASTSAPLALGLQSSSNKKLLRPSLLRLGHKTTPSGGRYIIQGKTLICAGPGVTFYKLPARRTYPTACCGPLTCLPWTIAARNSQSFPARCWRE